MDKKENGSAKAWYVSCSPRSPEKIAPELKLMKDASGKIWSGVYTLKYHKSLNLPLSTFQEKRDLFEKQKKDNQEEIARKLANLEDFKGDTFEKEISFSIRDRVAPMKTYGFLFTDSENKLVITPAGMMIIENKRPKEVFLKQFLKWQYPSYQHGTARPHPNKYPSLEFNIFPFVSTITFISKLEGLTKYELAIFGLTTRKFDEINEVITEIEQFREKLSKITGKIPRKQFIYDYHYSRFLKIYEKEYLSGKKIREGKTEDGLKEYIDTKIRNSLDIADASIRYFRYSGLLSSKGNRVTIFKDRIEDVNEILNSKYSIYPYDNVDNFYKYFGDYTLPKLKYEDKNSLIKRIKESDLISKAILENIIKINPKTTCKLIQFDSIEKKNVEELKDLYYEVIQNMILLKREALVIELQNSKIIEERIIPDLNIFTKSNDEINDEVTEKFLVDKNSVFEFVVWRAMIALGKAIQYKNNFIIDEDLKIVHHAAGNQGDMEIYYDDFEILVEVTTSSGVAQFNMEKEPVTRHYENIREVSKKQTYCMFIAKEVNDNTYKEFYRYNLIKKSKIVPLTLIQFINIIRKQSRLLKSNKSVEPREIKDLLESTLDMSNVKNHEDWKLKIREIIDRHVSN